MKVAPGLKMSRLVLLDWDDRQSQKIGSPDNVTLKLHEVRKFSFCMIVDSVAGYSDFFLRHGVLCVPRSDK